MILLKMNGTYHNEGRIVLDMNKTIEWKELSSEKFPELPHNSNVEITITFNESDFLSGKNGIVWATYDSRQVEVIHSALIAQHLNSEIKNIGFGKENMFLINITNGSDINEAIDFIWRSDSGLRLKPDWTYPDRETNKSFELWLNGQ
ncbi:MAG: hypothetical protein A2V93_02645 [Ignavibacteria bacterium RBG_16_34_14]|nr:MAG: hypothetical protein A2V93_02645 [Ignavibacteria bacterium RBG_16_34_14]